MRSKSSVVRPRNFKGFELTLRRNSQASQFADQLAPKASLNWLQMDQLMGFKQDLTREIELSSLMADEIAYRFTQMQAGDSLSQYWGETHRLHRQLAVFRERKTICHHDPF
jgi:hypothetical protein